MKWIGQNIYDQISRFRNDVFFETAVDLQGTLSAAAAVSFTDSLTVNGTTSFTTTANARPVVEIKNTGNNAQGGFLQFILDKGAAGADDDIPGKITWAGDDDEQQQVTFGSIYTQVADATDGQEAGSMTFQVAAYDGVLETGLKLDGDTNADGEVDVTIGSGAGSTTTIASGVVMMGSLPTSDPGVSGQLWNNSGVVNVSE